MAETFVARVRAEGKITIPKELRTIHNINQGDLIHLTLKKPEWWEMLDWNEMSQKAFDALPEEIKQKIKTHQERTK